MNGRLDAARLRGWLIDGNRGVGGQADWSHPCASTRPECTDRRRIRLADPGGGKRHRDGTSPARRTGRLSSSASSKRPVASRTYGAVTGWAAFAGTVRRSSTEQVGGGEGELPVPLVVATRSSDPILVHPDFAGPARTSPSGPSSRRAPGRDRATSAVRRSCVAPTARARGQRDRDGRGRPADLAAALRQVRGQRNAWTGYPRPERRGAGRDGCRSPQEFRMYLCLAPRRRASRAPVNREVYDLDGRLIGVPDLFDPEAGLVGEYQGEDHKDGAASPEGCRA